MKKKRFLGVLLSLAMVLGLLSGMSLTAYAADGYNQYAGFGEYDAEKGGYATEITLEVGDSVTVNYTKEIEHGLFYQNPNSERKLYVRSSNGVMTVTANAVGDYSFPVKFMTTDSIVLTVHVRPVLVTGVTLDKSSVALTVGGMETLTTTVTAPDNATDKSVNWSSSNQQVARVADGIVTAVGAGTADITVTASNGTDDTSDDQSATCTVTVYDPYTIGTVWLCGDTINLHGGWFINAPNGSLKQHSKEADATLPTPTIQGRSALFPTFLPVDRFIDVVSGNEESAPDGARSQLEAAVPSSRQGKIPVGIILVKGDGTKGSPYEFELAYKDVTGVTLDKTALSMVGDMDSTVELLIATVSPDDASDKTVVWSNSDDTIIYSSSQTNDESKGYDNLCNVRPKKAGTATITVTATNGTEDTADDKSATCTVTVYDPYPVGTVWHSDDPINLHGAYFISQQNDMNYLQHSKDEDATLPKLNAANQGSWVQSPVFLPVSEHILNSNVYPYDEGKTIPLNLMVPDGKAGEQPLGVKLVAGKGTGTSPYEFELAYKTDPTVTAPAAKTLTYSGQAQELVTAGAAEGGEIQYALGTDAAAAPASGWGTSIPAATDAGTYYVWYQVIGDATHNDITPACVTVTIGKASITISADDAIGPYPLPDDLELTCHVFGNISEADRADLGIQLALNTGAETTENGRRIIPIIVKSYEPNGNYEITTEEGKYTVISDDNDDSQFWFTVNGFLGEYDGYSHGIDSDSNGDYRVICFTKNELAIPQKLTTAELEKFLDENSENDVSFTEEGSYTGYYYILSNQGELFSGSKDVVITPKPATVIADAKSKSYGEPDPKLTYEAEGLVKTTNAEGIEMAEQLTGELSREPGENAGTYAIRLGNLQEANHNYALTFVGADLTITKADPEITLEPQAGKLDWTGAAQTLLTEGSAEGGTLQYALGNNASTAPTTGWGTSVPAAADAETYYVWYKVIGDSNHNDTAPVCITVTIDATGHTHKLTRTEAVAATCERDGTEAYWICSDCGKLFRDAGGKNEIETPVTIPATGHDWGEWTVNTTATEYTEGVETRTCRNDAGHTETRVIPVLGHTHKLTRTEAVAATCEEDGNIEFWTCDDCRNLFGDAAGTRQINREDTVVKATGHDWGEWTVATPATETENGQETRTCRNDAGHTETRIIPALGHTHKLTRTEAIAATCLQDGTEAYWICSDCGKLFRDAGGKNEIETPVTIPATGHDWGEWVVTAPATETENGQETRICGNDPSHTETRIIPALNHTHKLTRTEAVAATCEEDGNIEYWSCDSCRNLFSDAAGTRQINREDTVVKATGHDWGEWTVTTPATMAQEGIETRTCRNDPNHTETRTIGRLKPQPGPSGGVGGGGGAGGGVTTYTVTVSDAENGAVTADKNTAGANAKVTLTVKPSEGYQLDKLTVTDRNNNVMAVTENTDGTCSFNMPASNVTVTPVFTAIPAPAPAEDGACPMDAGCPISAFSDASPTAWYHDGVHWALEEGVMNGVGDGLFAPDGTTTRAMVVTMLWRLEGQPDGGSSPFSDVPAGTWYTQAVSWAAETGVVKGISETMFAPDAPVTREQLVTILHRYAENKGMAESPDANILDYEDVSDVSTWAVLPFRWAVQEGIVEGVGANRLAPGDNATRAQIATLFMRFVEAMAE